MITNKKVEEQVIGVLKEIYDPELPVNIYDLGLIYFVKVKESKDKGNFFVNVESYCFLLGEKNKSSVCRFSVFFSVMENFDCFYNEKMFLG